MKKKLLSALVASISLGLAASYASAEEAVVYVEGATPDNLSINVNDELYYFDESAVAVLDLEPGQYSGELSLESDVIGDVTFEVQPGKGVEVKVVYKGGGLSTESEAYGDGDQAIGSLVGRVFSSGGESALSNAKVRVEGSNYATATDESGAYTLALPRGVYTVVISHSDYAERTVSNVRILADVATEASLSLAEVSAGIMEEVLILGVRSGLNESSLAIERDSTSVIEAISAEDFKKFGDSSASDALKRVTGVSIVGGQFAVVRGLANRYISTTLDSGLLPSTDPFRRDVPLDLFPSGILKGIEISKSFSPNLPGDSTGGHVAMTLVDRPTEYTNKISVSLGYNSDVTGKDVLTYDGGDRDWTGYDDGTREIPSVIDQATDFGQTQFFECLPSLPTPGCIPAEDIRAWTASLPANYETSTTSAKPEFGLGYSLGNVFDIAFGEVGIYGAIDYAQKRDNREETETAENRTTTSDFTLSRQATTIRSRFNVDLSALLVAGIEIDNGTELTSKTVLLRKTNDTLRFSDTEDLDDNKTFERTELQWVERQLLDQQFSGKHILGSSESQELSWLVNFSNSQRSEPDRRVYTYENGSLTASQVFRSYAELDEDSTSFKLDYSIESGELFGAYIKYQLGVFGADKDRTQQIARFGYSIRDASIDRTQNIDSILSLDNINNDAVKILSQRDPNDKYEASETTTAGYVNAEFDFAGEWIANVGFRYESLDQEVRFPNEDSSSNPVDKPYSELLPALNLVWKQSEGLQWRAALSKTIARPGLTEVADAVFFDEDGNLFRGNPDLSISTITNVDFKFEYYWDDEQSLSIGLFAKDISDPIETTLLRGSGSSADGFTFANQESGEVIGVEFDILKNIYEGDSWLFTLQANFAWIDSEVSLEGEALNLEGRPSRQLQGQSEYVGNLRLGVEDISGHHNFNFLINYFDDRIDAVNNVSSGDRIEEGRTTVDFVYSADITEQFSLSAKAQNLLDEEAVFFTEGQFERSEETLPQGVSFKLGASYKF